jgi:hypothetical protein
MNALLTAAVLAVALMVGTATARAGDYGFGFSYNSGYRPHHNYQGYHYAPRYYGHYYQYYPRRYYAAPAPVYRYYYSPYYCYPAPYYGGSFYYYGR